MAPIKFKSILALEENGKELFMESTEVLLKIAGRIINEPGNPKFRSISLGSKAVTNKLLPASGAMECLYEMGFEEGVDKLILPQNASLETLKNIYDELLKIRNLHTSSNKTVEPVNTPKSAVDENTALIVKDLLALSAQIKNSFFKRLIFWCFGVLKCESHKLQLKALKLVPLVELNLRVMKVVRNTQMELKKKKENSVDLDYQEFLLLELCNWFNTEFFSWVDTPQCTKCGFLETVEVGVSSKKFEGAERVERYKCQKCEEEILFPRYNNPEKLLETRKGRCGEWANCFCLFARALGWDARLVFDATDHVWVEIYSIIKAKWIHCDPCENAVDTPLMYECGWKKKLSYIIAYSKDEIQDVTWRYSCKHAEVLKNRKECSEQELIDFIIKVRNILLGRASPARRNFVLKRTVLELVELMKQKSATSAEERGRISGSLAWRLLRGETTNEDNFNPYVWKIEPEDDASQKFVLSYITSRDQYLKNSKPVLKTWRDGLFSLKSVFRKEEKDWKMTYLARLENSDKGILSWKFDTGDKFVIGTINLKLIQKTFETGMIACRLYSGETRVPVPVGKESFLTDAFMGSKTVELIVELFGGSGPQAWQHAQILRQPLSSDEATFTKFIPKPGTFQTINNLTVMNQRSPKDDKNLE